MRISDWSSDVCSSDLGTTAYLEDEAFIEKSKDAARKSLRGLFERADAQLANNDWIAGGRSIADPYLYVVTRWAKGQGVDLSGLDHLARFFAQMEADAAVQKVLAEEGLSCGPCSSASWTRAAPCEALPLQRPAPVDRTVAPVFQ